MKGNLYSVPLMLVLTGCSVPEIVRSPADAQSAKLRFVTTSARSDGTYLWRVDRSMCPASTKPLLVATTGDPEKSPLTMIGSSNAAQAKIREIYVPAATPLTFYVTASRYQTYSCDNAVVFQPIPGREYELRYIVEPETFVCIIQLDELQQGADGQVTRQREASAHYFHPPSRAADYCSEAPRAN